MSITYARDGKQPIRPSDFRPFVSPSTAELTRAYSKDVMERARELMARVHEVNRGGAYRPTWESLDSHQCPEWFMDAKFGMFIDWGLYSIPAYAPSGYPDWYLLRMFTDTRDYHERYWGKDFRIDDFIPLFTAEDFDAERIAQAAADAGMRYVIPFLKHHDGFCLWDSSFTLRTSVRMGPHRDLAREMLTACRRRDLKFGFYYSIDDWFHPVIGRDGNVTVRAWNAIDGRDLTHEEYEETRWERFLSGKIPVEDFYDDYINPAAVEFFDRYDPDIFWGDGDWIVDSDDRKSRAFLSYFYNRAEGRKEVASNDRLGCCRLIPTLGQRKDAEPHGDFFCSECLYEPGRNPDINRPWEENHGLSHSFGYNWRETEADVRSARELLHMLVDVVASGGNMLLITNLTPTGRLDPLLAERLKAVGAWLRVNGEAIYATRKWDHFSDGRQVRYTRSKDGRFLYAISLADPGSTLRLPGVRVGERPEITLLGVDRPLDWRQEVNDLAITVPRHSPQFDALDAAWVFRIDGMTPYST